MTNIQYNRRNFLSSIAILSAGTAFGSTIKHFSPPNPANDLQKKWIAFWKKSGGRVYSLANLKDSNNTKETKGHYYKYGEIIYFPKENMLAQPTWIFWNNRIKPADVVVTLFENNHSSSPIVRFNRYEMDALYLLSGEPGSGEVLLASCNNAKRITGESTQIIKTKTNIKKNSRVQEISYYKGPSPVLHKKFIYHT